MERYNKPSLFGSGQSIAVSAIGAANFADAIQAGSETVLASYSSSAQSDILLTGGKLGSQLQSEVHASASMTTTDATGHASFDFPQKILSLLTQYTAIPMRFQTLM